MPFIIKPSLISKPFVLVLLIWAVSIKPLISQNPIKSFHSKRIEMLVEDSLLQKINNQHGFSDSLFAITYHSLNELEKNLVYKMSDQLHFILFDDLNKFDQYQRSHQIGLNEHSNNQGKEYIYFPIFLNGNYTDITYQLRYGAAQQFLQEYLNGLSLKDKFNPENNQKIPSWLIAGFINYFAGGIKHEDFEYFQTQVKNGRYRNINFIKNEESQLFGTAIWYLLEKEKGREFNGAFWMLIKYANSFEKSFLYHFNIKFKQWMLEELSKIKQINKEIPKNNDFKSHLPLKNCRYLKVHVNNKSEFQSLKFFSNGFNICKIQENETSSKKTIGTPPSQSFNLPHTFFDTENNIFLLEFENGNWNILKNGEYFKTLGSTGQYQAFDISINEYALIHQCLDYSNVLIKSKINHTTLRTLRFSGIKITGILKLNNNEYVFGLDKRNLKSNRSKAFIDIIKFADPKSWKKVKTIAQSAPNLIATKYTDFILEKTGQLGFVENSTNYRSYNICYYSDTQTKVLPINTKGYFYGVSRNYNTSFYCEYFIDQDNFYYNLIPVGSDVNPNDTFLQQEGYTRKIDSAKKETVILKEYERGFVSAFNKIDERTIPQMLVFRKESQKHLVKNYQNWKFIKNSSYYFSNQELDLPYTTDIPATELYNSIATVFFNIKINQSLGRNSSDITLFSNANRRRLGLSASYFTNIRSMNWNTNLLYRLRQFSDYDEKTTRNRSIRIKSDLIKDYSKFSSSVSAIIDRNETVQSNSSLEQLYQLNQSEYSLRLEGKINFNDLNRVVYNSSNNYNVDFLINSGLFIDNQSNSSPILDLGINASGSLNWKAFTLNGKINSRLSITERNQIWLIGGSNGWLSSSPFTDISKRQLNTQYSTFLQQGSFIRGFQSGSRVGTSFLGGQNELQLNPLQIIPSLVLESKFWKSFRIIGFFDWGMGFVTLDPGHFDNPYNTIFINHPNYILTASANRSPWLYSYGYGVSLEVVNTTFRLEFANPYEYHKKLNPALLLSLGKNF